MLTLALRTSDVTDEARQACHNTSVMHTRSLSSDYVQHMAKRNGVQAARDELSGPCRSNGVASRYRTAWPQLHSVMNRHLATVKHSAFHQGTLAKCVDMSATGRQRVATGRSAQPAQHAIRLVQ